MTNRVRGEVRADLGGASRLFVVSHGVIAEVEGELRDDGWPIFVQRILKGKFRFTDLALLLSAAAKEGGRGNKQAPLSFEEVMDLCVKDFPSVQSVAGELILALYKGAEDEPGKAGATEKK